MKNFLQKYFLAVANKPFKSALRMTVLLFIILFIGQAILNGTPPFFSSANKALIISLYAFLFLIVLNLVIPALFITFFYPEKGRVVITKIDESLDRWAYYDGPVWGKIPYLEIIFPDNFNFEDLSRVQKLDLKIIFALDSQVLAFLVMTLKFDLRENFQASDLHELIKMQKSSKLKKTRFDFVHCLQKIASQYLSERQALIAVDFAKWHSKQLSLDNLEEKWFRSELIFPKLFVNVKNLEIFLHHPEIVPIKSKRKH